MENDQSSDFEQILDEKVEKGVGFWTRFLAALIDFLVMLPLMGLTFYGTYFLKDYSVAAVALLLQVLYKPIVEGMYGATLGKMALKLTVINKQSDKITFKEAIVRYILWIPGGVVNLISSVAIFSIPEFIETDGYFEAVQVIADYNELNGMDLVTGLGYVFSFLILLTGLSISFNKKKQGWHDLLAGTRVIEEEK